MNFSKSKYCGFWQCPKIAWLSKYRPDERTISDDLVARMETGNAVGDLAKGLFGDYVDVTVIDENGKIDINSMLFATAEQLKRGTENICEASFNYKGLYCAVDILRKAGNGYSIYEVKSSTHESTVYFADIAYQRYVLEHCGVNVIKTYLININNAYVFDGEFKPDEFFRITDVTREVEFEYDRVENNLILAEGVLSNDTEPDIDLSESCNDPYPCLFWKYCSRGLPTPSVFDLYKLPFKNKIDYYRKGQTSYEQLSGTKAVENAARRRQVESYINDETYVDKLKIRSFLSTLSYPLYFLDFESMQPVIPLFVGTRPYQQITFQYSLHYIESENGELRHKEFLAESGVDPRRAVAESLVADIPTDVCVIVYNKTFECGRLKELADAFPDLADRLLKIRNNIVDLIIPFRNGAYYNKNMGGSFSIKSVLPAMFPGDPSLDYHNLEGVHNGGEAMSVFPRIKDMPKEEAEKARKDLLKYCELDTLAMVKLWQGLLRLAK